MNPPPLPGRRGGHSRHGAWALSIVIVSRVVHSLSCHRALVAHVIPNRGSLYSLDKLNAQLCSHTSETCPIRYYLQRKRRSSSRGRSIKGIKCDQVGHIYRVLSLSTVASPLEWPALKHQCQQIVQMRYMPTWGVHSLAAVITFAT